MRILSDIVYVFKFIFTTMLKDTYKYIKVVLSAMMNVIIRLIILALFPISSVLLGVCVNINDRRTKP